MKLLLKEDAEKLLSWAYDQNPGPWAEHSRVAARLAQAISKAAGLDADRAYISGLLHDIGRYEGVRGFHHVYAGHELLKKEGYGDLAEICLSHSFPFQHIGSYSGGDYDCTSEELAVITDYLDEASYNDYDKLIQLCDSMAMAEGVSIIEKRIVNVVIRYGFDEFTVRKWESIFALKSYFDGLIGGNIYDLFYDEIRDISFR